MSNKLLFDKGGAAEVLSTTERRIDELRRAGELTAVQDGRQFKFTAAELQRYVDSLETFEPRRSA
jgi:excisionase family DNA binding protein